MRDGDVEKTTFKRHNGGWKCKESADESKRLLYDICCCGSELWLMRSPRGTEHPTHYRGSTTKRQPGKRSCWLRTSRCVLTACKQDSNLGKAMCWSGDLVARSEETVQQPGPCGGRGYSVSYCTARPAVGSQRWWVNIAEGTDVFWQRRKKHADSVSSLAVWMPWGLKRAIWCEVGGRGGGWLMASNPQHGKCLLVDAFI